jgi:hypothetical protein
MLLRYGRSVWRSGQGCFSAKTGPWASRRCVHCLRGPSGETWILRGRLPLPEARLGRGKVVSLEWTEPLLNRTHQAFAALCWWGYQLRLGVLGVPLIMVPTLKHGNSIIWTRLFLEVCSVLSCGTSIVSSFKIMGINLIHNMESDRGIRIISNISKKQNN